MKNPCQLFCKAFNLAYFGIVVILARATRAPPSLTPNRLSPTIVPISSQSLSRIRLLVWPAPLIRVLFCKGLRDRTWHVPQLIRVYINDTIVFPTFRRVERIFARPDQTSRSGFRCENAWTHIHTLIHTYIHTYIHT